jgi:hypothetical protein
MSERLIDRPISSVTDKSPTEANKIKQIMLKTHQVFKSQKHIVSVTTFSPRSTAYRKQEQKEHLDRKKVYTIIDTKNGRELTISPFTDGVSSHGLAKKPNKKKWLLSEDTGCTRHGGESWIDRPQHDMKIKSKRVSSAGAKISKERNRSTPSGLKLLINSIFPGKTFLNERIGSFSGKLRNERGQRTMTSIPRTKLTHTFDIGPKTPADKTSNDP